ncbi:LOW QUALITY PROTEIN: hypothetical protein QC763_606960 [Podospora pseudopauciseta]|uniref:Uncharacterized protein n=1 Tax=Podospora pseudopauciseta TaxID=2093780 RepID=A0ABR0H5D9_9PEZI|nr:LOW QUALITY PROTEIN: hypothetical protein QC763_606960 [Podospora pseudopauciseta]
MEGATMTVAASTTDTTAVVEEGRYESTDEDDEGGDGEGWHELVDIIDARCKIKKLATTDGNTLRENMEIEDGDLDKNLVQDYEDLFENSARAEEDYSRVHRQRGSLRVTLVAVIVPNDEVDQFLITGTSKKKEAQGLLPRYLEKCSNPDERESTMKNVRTLAQLVWAAKPDPYGYILQFATRDFNEETALKFLAAVLQ